MLKSFIVECTHDNEWGFFTVGKRYTVINDMISDDRDPMVTNFGNVKRRFKVISNSKLEKEVYKVFNKHYNDVVVDVDGVVLSISIGGQQAVNFEHVVIDDDFLMKLEKLCKSFDFSYLLEFGKEYEEELDLHLNQK